MLLLEKIISLYAPFRCIGCGKENDLLVCTACCQATPRVPSRCYRCRAVTRDFATCQTCRQYTPLRHAYVAMHYDGLAKELLHAAKYERARAGVLELAETMTPLLSFVSSDMLVVPVPTATSRVRQRGYDQAYLLARELAKQSGLHVLTALVRMGQAHQVGANRTERLQHLEGAFRVVHEKFIRDKHIILVDDVLTTGATLETAARTLKKAGAKNVDALVFCQAG